MKEVARWDPASAMKYDSGTVRAYCGLLTVPMLCLFTRACLRDRASGGATQSTMGILATWQITC